MKPRNDVKTLKIMRRRYIIMMMVAAVMAVGCGGGGSQKADGPEAVVTAFNRAMASGDWDEASGLCDTSSMEGYISAYQEAWDYLHKQDSSVMMIASQMLSAASVEVVKVEKIDGGRSVHYIIEAEGMRKERKALVSKDEEGAWKVTAITDAN